MKSPKKNTKKQPLTPVDPVDPSDFDSTPVSKHMSKPRTVKPFRAAGHLKKMASVLASLYNEVDQGTLKSPIYAHGSLQALPRNTIIDLTTPEATSNHSTGAKAPMDPKSITEGAEDGMDVDEAVSGSSMVKINNIRSEWVGTSQFFIDQNVEWQQNGQLISLILYLRATQHDLSRRPYDPCVYTDLSRIISKIGFTDIGTSMAYRAILLIEGYIIRDPDIYPHVRDVLSKRLQSQSPLIIDDELQSQHLHAYRELLSGMLGCGCYWDGIVVAKKAVQLFPGDPDLLETRQWLKDGFTDRCDGLKKLGADPQDLIVRSRIGKLYQKPYPWMDKNLFKRNPALVREANKNFGAGNCEVRPVVFGTASQPRQVSARIKEQKDVGPLGVFAIKSIQEGETVLVDQCLTVISDIPSSRLDHCDACHASLKYPFQHPTETVKPSCCKAVAFCSRSCYEIASKGYHSVVCGKDFDWLYEETNPGVSAGAGYKWPPIMFVRFMGIIIADRRAEIKAGKKPTHPLQHPLMARMTANYSPPNKLHPDEFRDWDYNGNIVAPTNILMMLGINIFTDPDFSQDVIQTIFWRMQNNANMSTCDLSLSDLSPQAQSTTSSSKSAIPYPSEDKSNKNKVQMICLNPCYLFFNHSCDPNISWHGAIPDPWVGLEWITGYNGEIMKPGSSAVFCRAARDIKAGEELKISYVGDPTGGEEGGVRELKRNCLKKWFEEGCGCELCAKENAERQAKRRESGGNTNGGDSIDLDVLMKLEKQI